MVNISHNSAPQTHPEKQLLHPLSSRYNNSSQHHFLSQENSECLHVKQRSIIIKTLPITAAMLQQGFLGLLLLTPAHPSGNGSVPSYHQLVYSMLHNAPRHRGASKTSTHTWILPKRLVYVHYTLPSMP